jgi:hypothetical protein
MQFFGSFSTQIGDGLILKMSNLALMRIKYALNCVNRAKKRDFYVFLSPFDAFKLLFFTFCFNKIVGNYQNYHIIK